MRFNGWIGLIVGGLGATAAFGACGGSVVFVEDDGAGGSSSSSSTAKSTVSGSSKSNVTATQATSTSVTTVTATTTGPDQPFCVWGDIAEECFDCADQASVNACSTEADACGVSDECFSYADCVGQCFNDPNCCSNCVNFFPDGAQIYSNFLYCIVCQACADDCAGATPGFCK